MSVIENESAFVVRAAQQISVSKMFTITPSSAEPSYVVLTGLDRSEYSAGATGATGSVSGSGKVDTFSYLSGDSRSLGIVFYRAANGLYYSPTYGYLNQLVYTASGSLNDVTSLSLFGTNDYSLAQGYATNPYALMQFDGSGYLGSVTIATQPAFASAVPAQATPGSIASTAMSFVGRAWNMYGCWVLASTIAAEAGAGLPAQSTMVGQPGKANGEWIVAFNGPTGQGGDWRSMVKAGDIIVFGNASTAHITTCVSGSGSTAMLVDNITYVDQSGRITNLAKDGSSSDVTIAAPHAASVEWAGIPANEVVIYRLDTPAVAETVAAAKLGTGATLALQPIFSASDPAGKPITEYQVYDSASGDRLLVNGAATDAHTAGTARTLTSLNGVCLLAGSTSCTDTVEVRAFNGSYWGDWTALTVSVIAPSVAQAQKAPQSPAAQVSNVAGSPKLVSGITSHAATAGNLSTGSPLTVAGTAVITPETLDPHPSTLLAGGPFASASSLSESDLLSTATHGTRPSLSVPELTGGTHRSWPHAGPGTDAPTRACHETARCLATAGSFHPISVASMPQGLLALHG